MTTHIIRNQEWLNQNASRNYPLVEESQGVSADGAFQIPDDFLVSLYLFIPFSIAVDSSKFFIRRIFSSPATGYAVTVGYQADSGPVDVASAAINRTGQTRFKPYRLGGLGDFFDAYGSLVVGSLETIDQQPAGDFTFAWTDARLETDAVRPLLRSIPYVEVQNGADISDPVFGPLLLRAGSNCRIDLTYAGDVPIITFNAIDGSGLVEVCANQDNPSEPIRTLSDILPDAQGNIEILGSDCIKVVPVAHGLRLENTCAKPCCGATELLAITQVAEQLSSKIQTMESRLTRLETEVSNMRDSFLSSILDDGGCTTCP